jgi:hypothetical protein
MLFKLTIQNFRTGSLRVDDALVQDITIKIKLKERVFHQGILMLPSDSLNRVSPNPVSLNPANSAESRFVEGDGNGRRIGEKKRVVMGGVEAGLEYD